MKIQYYSIEQIKNLNILSIEDINKILSNERFNKYILKDKDNILINSSLLYCIKEELININENKNEYNIIDVIEENKLLKLKIEELNNKLLEYTDKFIDITNKAQSIAENIVLSNREQNIIKAIDGESPQKKNIFKRLFKKSRE